MILNTKRKGNGRWSKHLQINNLTLFISENKTSKVNDYVSENQRMYV